MSFPTIDFDKQIEEIRQKLREKPKTASEVRSKVAYLEVWSGYLVRINSERSKSGLPIAEHEKLIAEMRQQRTELEKILPELDMKERISRVLNLAKPLYPFLSIECNETLEARLTFPCGHNTTIPLLELNKNNESEYRSWLNQLELLLEARLDELSFGIGCTKCKKSSLSVKLCFDPQRIITLAKQGKIVVR